MTLRALDVGWTRSGRLVLDGVTLDPQPGTTVGLLGPNGSGKSSLLRIAAGLNKPDNGRVLLDDRDIQSLRRRDIAKLVAVVGQHSDTDIDITVVDVVRLGRIPHRGPFGASTAGDDKAVEAALAATDLLSKRDRLWHSLSGGERQRVHIARALAQRPRELLLDEPTNHLDIAHQLDILRLVRALPITSVIALHDLNLAATFCDQVIVLSEGSVVAAGPPPKVLTERMIHAVYGVRSEITVHGDLGRPHIRFLAD